MDLVEAVLSYANSREDPAAPPIEQRADLVERLCSGAELTQGERWYLGALELAARWRSRPDPLRVARHREIAICARLYRIIEGGKNYRAVEETAKALKVSKTTVRTALRELAADPSESLDDMLAHFAAGWVAHCNRAV